MSFSFEQFINPNERDKNANTIMYKNYIIESPKNLAIKRLKKELNKYHQITPQIVTSLCNSVSTLDFFEYLNSTYLAATLILLFDINNELLIEVDDAITATDIFNQERWSEILTKLPRLEVSGDEAELKHKIQILIYAFKIYYNNQEISENANEYIDEEEILTENTINNIKSHINDHMVTHAEN